MAVRFLSPGLPSFWTSSSSVPDFSGPVSRSRVRIFYGELCQRTAMFPFMSLCTTPNAAVPNRSNSATTPSVADMNSTVATPFSVIGTSLYV